jgi:hypothetical protein
VTADHGRDYRITRKSPVPIYSVYSVYSVAGSDGRQFSCSGVSRAHEDSAANQRGYLLISSSPDLL